MNFKECLDEMKKIQEKLLDYIESQGKNTPLNDLFIEYKYENDQKKLISLLHLVLKISNNHYSNKDFYNRIEEILQFFKEDIKAKIQNFELFHIFKSNKKILLFLHQEGMLTFDEQIVKKIVQFKSNYPQYFSPEIRPFINKKWFPNELKENNWIKQKLPDDFYEKRKKGENDSFICKLIRKDSIDDFVRYINQNQYKLNSIIKPSIYETNKFLIKKDEISLIEYAVFFGSIQIFNYLRLNKINLTSSLWLFAIHGKNAEIIHLLEENRIVPKDRSYKQCLIESIKCHHNDIANYILNQYILTDKNISNDILVNCLKYYNLNFDTNNLINESSFYYMCKYDYCLLVYILVKEKMVDINTKMIYTILI